MATYPLPTGGTLPDHSLTKEPCLFHMDTSATLQLLERLKADDHTALQLIFTEFYPSVCRWISPMLPDHDTVEDLAQEVFIRFWEKRHQIEIHSSLPAYIRQMAIFEALAFLRRRRFFEEVPETIDPETTPLQNLQHHDLQTALESGLQKLPPKCRVVFQLSRLEGMSYAEIAAQTGISVKTVENQISKALKILRVHLDSFLEKD